MSKLEQENNRLKAILEDRSLKGDDPILASDAYYEIASILEVPEGGSVIEVAMQLKEQSTELGSDRGKYIYHYTAHYQNHSNQVVHIDGILVARNKILTHEQYREIKPVINKENAHMLTVVSFSCIGREFEE